jgi:drug/metabolite transporter (DMT)-like permease
LLLLAFIWGWSFLFIKVAVGGMTPPTVAATRMALGALVIVSVARARRLSLPEGTAWWRHFVVVAVFGSAIPFTLLPWGEQHVSSALTAVLNASTPLFTAVMAAVIVGDRLRPVPAGGLVLGFVGVAVAAGVGGSQLSGSSLGGELAAVAAAASYGVSFAYSRRHLVTLPPVLAAAGQLLTGALLLLPAAVVTSVQHGIEVTPRRALAISLLGLFGTGFAYVLSYRLIADVGATRAAVVTYLIPVVAVTVGVLFLHDPFSFRLVVGGVLIILGIRVLGSGNRVAVTGRPIGNEIDREVRDEAQMDRRGGSAVGAGGGWRGRRRDVADRPETGA